MKKFISIFLVFSMNFLSGCGIIKELSESKNESIKIIENFCIALSNSDIETAKTYLHPDSMPKKADLAAYVTILENRYNIDFSDGVSFYDRKSIESTYYDSSYDGTIHKIEYEIVVGNVHTDFYFNVLKNDAGFGIYNFGLTYKK
ncbi:MAG: hypothetical protein IKC22_05185 [Bacilli bacterium]|nr:hypothetical protein [Bacilli bacterium]